MERKANKELLARVAASVAEYESSLVAFRRDLHMHPETSFQEFRTTERIMEWLVSAGLAPIVLPRGVGAMCDVGSGAGPVVALRADIDALSLTDEKPVPYRSRVPGVCHACGHDVHTTVVLGAGLLLNRLAMDDDLPGTVRLVFQPGEEVLGGATEVVTAGGLADVGRMFALHCEPRYEVGTIGLREGAITGGFDKICVRVGGSPAGDHHPDPVYALAKIVTELPAALSRRIDPRSGLSLVWGTIRAVPESGLLPARGLAEGTVRCLEEEARRLAPGVIEEVVRSVASAYDIEASLDYVPGIPPTVNESGSVNIFRETATSVLGEEHVLVAPQSLGGDDFGIYLQQVPGAYARLGVRAPGQEVYDLHRGTFDVDEACISVGAGILAAVALNALAHG
ncbi:MAG: amidohydrolase [Hamadaea sp.]|nr:amidohydrolase [Nonomuraea sp.]NUR72125.1 amidohydrolase [Hamadaea sp.]